jgi:hypothetical protein
MRAEVRIPWKRLSLTKAVVRRVRRRERCWRSHLAGGRWWKIRAEVRIPRSRSGLSLTKVGV